MKKSIQFKSFCLIVATYFSLVINFPFWKELIKLSHGIHGGDLYNYLTIFVIFTVSFFVLLHTLLFKYVTKIVSIILITLSAFASYAILNFNLRISSIIIRSLFETTDHLEILAFISPNLLMHIGLFILLPSGFISILRIEYPRASTLIISKFKFLCASFLILILTYLSNQLFINTLVDKADSRHLKTLIIPFNVIKGLKDYWNERPQPLSEPLIRTESRHLPQKTTPESYPPLTPSPGRKKLLVLVLGESARSSSFSLNGYQRETNPELKKFKNLVSFNQFYSCGTATALSIPCMFSSLGREKFNYKQADEQENLLQVTRRNSIEVKWYDNGMGVQNVVRSGIEEIKLGSFYEAELDTILTQKIPSRDELIRSNHNRMIILHQRGSHGPDYWKRYPKEFAVFKPDCSSAALSTSCTRDEVINAYDNTIAFTDHTLSEAIQTLEQLSDLYDTALLYLSDHGESTGEYGIYMHGLPYSIAPIEQTHIPFIVWFSDSFMKNRGIDLNCVSKKKSEKYSHDHLFSSVLTLFDIASSTPQYQKETDLFQSCIKK